jgi:hypothetical protein
MGLRTARKRRHRIALKANLNLAFRTPAGGNGAESPFSRTATPFVVLVLNDHRR